jgi:hypothetical protein
LTAQKKPREEIVQFMIEAQATAQRMHARPVAYDPKNRKVKLTAPGWPCPCWIPLDAIKPEG